MTGTTIVIKWIIWPHELVYVAEGKPAMYNKMTLPLFVSGYLTVVDIVRLRQKGIMLKHLKELTLDTELYGWKPIKSYHAP